MKSAWRAAFVFLPIILGSISARGAGKATRDSAELEAQADPTAAPTIELEQEDIALQPHGAAVHGTGFLSFKAPNGSLGGLDLLMLQGELRWSDGTWGLFTTPRLKIQPMGTTHDKMSAYFQQAYGYVRHPWGEVKAGKIYQRFGRLWDYGYTGPLVANFDIKLQPDLGVSFEGAPALGHATSLEYAAQYFATDGHALSLFNRSLLSMRNVRRQNIVVVRAAPTYHLNHQGTVALGLSGQRFDVNAPGFKQVLRGAVDADVAYGPWNAFAEMGRQLGSDRVIDSGDGVSANTYVLAGVMYTYASLSVRMHANVMHFDEGFTDVLYQPGVEWTVTDNFALLGEGVWWTSGSADYANAGGYHERSISLIANAKF